MTIDADTHDTDAADDLDDARAFTQDEVSRVATREARKAAKAEREKLLEELGGMSPTEARKALDKAKAAEAKNQDESERRLAEANERLAQADAREAAAARTELEFRKATALAEVGLQGKAATRVARMLEVDVDATDDDLAEAIDDLRHDLPALFAADAATSPTQDRPAGHRTSAPSSTTKRGRSEQQRPPAATALEAGAALARRRFGLDNQTT